uniref:Putative treble-clef zinc-finger domain-containing protein n=1 Tax=Clastoptera arizonana TaxID=38151 RepID=A0A1B6DHN3_9HEMI
MQEQEERLKLLFKDIGKSTKRGIKKCPKCGTLNGIRGFACKNKACDFVYRTAAGKRKLSADICKRDTGYKKKIRNLQDVLSKSKSNKSEDKIATLSEQLRHAEENNESLKLENERLMTLLGQIEKTANENELLLEEKTHEIKILHNQIGILREESARQITRSKKTFDAMKTSMQVQISNLETVLIQTRGDVYASRRREQEAV